MRIRNRLTRTVMRTKAAKGAIHVQKLTPPCPKKAYHITYAALLKGWRKTVRNNLILILPVMIIAAAINPMSNHYGVTILGYLSNGNPFTLESCVYGLVMALMLAAVITWFSCYTEVMTSDKFIYLFGRLIPALSLVLSMALRFVPRFARQAGVIADGQKCVGRSTSNGNVLSRIKHGITIFSILITWALENAIETADSMKCRGYGEKGRTADWQCGSGIPAVGSLNALYEERRV